MRMRKTSLVAVVLGTLVLLASSCSETSDFISEETGQDNGRAMQASFEANRWQIVKRTGFATTPVDGLVSFEVVEGYPVINLTSLPCDRVGTSAIEWNEEGFLLVEPDDPNVGFGTNDNGCEPPDDLHLRFLSRGFNGDQINVELAEDGDTVTLIRGNFTLTLVPVR